MRPSPRAELSSAAIVDLDSALLGRWSLPVHEGGDKHDRGTVLIIGGSPTTPGAVLLAGVAALRMGAGRLQVVTAEPVAVAVGVAMPEAMVAPIPVMESGGFHPGAAMDMLVEHIGGADAVLIGPGMYDVAATAQVVSAVLPHVGDSAIVVLDAAALPAMVEVPSDALAAIHGRLVLTPNRQEARPLAELSSNGRDDDRDDDHDDDDDDDDDDVTLVVAQATGAVVTTFGRVASWDGRQWDCGSGTPGLGTSGSGDVLAGLVAGAAARCGDAAQAACWATHVHREAGERLSARLGRLGFLARELLDEVPGAVDAASARD